MVSSLSDGSTLITTTETELFAAITTLKYHSIWIFLDPMLVGDEYKIRVYVKDASGGTERGYTESVFIDVQSPPGVYLPPILMDYFRVTIQKIAGTDRTFKWRRGQS